MNVYMTEEEQVEQIKKLWKSYGNYLMSALLITVLIFTGYRAYQSREITLLTQASSAFNELMDSAAKNDTLAVEAKANYIKSTFPSTIYASSSALLLAKKEVGLKKYQAAAVQLEWVVKNTSSNSFKQLALLRLARIYLYQKKYNEALMSLDTIKDPSFISMIHEVKGDIYLSKNEKEAAIKQYQLSLSELPNSAIASKELMMKLNNLSA